MIDWLIIHRTKVKNGLSKKIFWLAFFAAVSLVYVCFLFIIRGNWVLLRLWFYCRIFADSLRNKGVGIIGVGFPATPILETRARFCISAKHTREQIDMVSHKSTPLTFKDLYIQGWHEKKKQPTTFIDMTSVIAPSPNLAHFLHI